VLGGVGQVVVHLDAQFAGRHHHQGAWDAGQRAGGVAADAVQQRYPEGEGLAHPGAGLADQVIAGQCQRQGELLDREGVLDAVLGEGADDLVAHAQVGEAGRGVAVQMCHVSSCRFSSAHELSRLLL